MSFEKASKLAALQYKVLYEDNKIQIGSKLSKNLGGYLPEDLVKCQTTEEWKDQIIKAGTGYFMQVKRRGKITNVKNLMSKKAEKLLQLGLTNNPTSFSTPLQLFIGK